MSPLIEFDGVSLVRDGATVIDNLNLAINQGQHTVILGPNGSGKSTLLKLLMHEIYPHAGHGSVRIMGQDRWIVRDLRTQIGVVSASASEKLVTDPTCLQMVASGYIGTYGITEGYPLTPSQWGLATKMLDFMGIPHLTDRHLAGLSAGELRRVLIARALITEPKALVLDEPTSSLDIRATHSFLQTIRRIAQAGTTLVLVTHHVEEVIPEIQRVVMLQKGRIVVDEKPDDALTGENLTSLFGISIAVSGPPWYAKPMTTTG